MVLFRLHWETGGGAGGAGGAIARPPSFGDLLSKFWEFLKKIVSLFTVAPS